MASRRSRSSYISSTPTRRAPNASKTSDPAFKSPDFTDQDIDSALFESAYPPAEQRAFAPEGNGSTAGSAAGSSTNAATANTVLPPNWSKPATTGPGFGLWRAIAGELNKLSVLQQETADTYHNAINENRLSGVLAVYDIVAPARLVSDYLSMVEKEGKDLLQTSQHDVEALRRAYADNRARLSKEKKALETVIESLRKLVPESLVPAILAASAEEEQDPKPAAIDKSNDDELFDLFSGTPSRKRRSDGEPKPFFNTKRAKHEAKPVEDDAAKPVRANTASKTGARPGPPQKEAASSPEPEPQPESYAFAATDTDAYMAALFRGFPATPLPVGAQVAFRLPHTRPTAEEEWIQCEVTRVYNDGVRYEVRDPEPDENGSPGQSYKAAPRDLLPIVQTAGVALPPYPVGAQVLARYPETTTFYRAEVMGTKRDGKCRLKFEGEEEENKEQEVERRVVLPIRNQR